MNAIPARLWTVLLAALAVRLMVWAWFVDIPPLTFDEKDFDAIATNLVERGEFAVEPGEPTSRRPPLYAWFLAGVYSLFSVGNYQAVRFFQIVINLLTIVVVFRLARDIYDERVGVWAAALAGFYPSLWGHDYLLLTEVLFTFWLCLGVHRLVRFYQTQECKHMAWAGVILGLAALTRSVMWPFPALFCLLLMCGRVISWRARVAAAVAFLVTFVATLTPWAIRNTRLQGALTVVDSIGAQILKWSHYPPKDMKETGEPAPATEGQQDWRNLQESLSVMGSRPLTTLGRMLENLIEFWRLDRELVSMMAKGRFGQMSSEIVLAAGLFVCGFYVLVMLTACVGAIFRPPANGWTVLPILCVVAHICLIHTLVYGHSRYHVPLIPLLAVFSASCIANWRSLAWRGRPFRLATCLVVVTFLIAAWIITFVAYDLAGIQQTLRL